MGSIVLGALSSLVFDYDFPTGLRYGLLIGLAPFGILLVVGLIMVIFEKTPAHQPPDDDPPDA